MSKLPILLFGFVELAFPRKIVEFGETLAFENPGESELRSRTMPAARVEGVAFLALVLRGERSYSDVAPLLGLIGIPAVLVPKRFVAAAMQISYRDSERIRLKSWVVPFTRFLGLVYMFVVLREFAERRSTR